MTGSFHFPSYQAHNKARLDHLALLGLPVEGKTVLEVGAGVGDHTGFFVKRGCTVTSTDARAPNVEQIRRRHPGVTAAVLDVEQPSCLAQMANGFDVVYCYGLLYHLQNPGNALRFLSSVCGGFLLLETCVRQDGEPGVDIVPDVVAACQSLHGTGCRPSGKWVWERLAELFPFIYMPTILPEHPEFDWSAPPSDGMLRRLIFIASRFPLSNAFLSGDSP